MKVKNIFFCGFEEDTYLRSVQKKFIALDCYKNKYFSFHSKLLKKKNSNINHISTKNFWFKNLKKKKLNYINHEIYFKISSLEKKMVELMVDRVNINLLSSWEKNIYINLLFSYWCNFFIKNKPSCIFFASAPHFPWDYVLYLIAKSKNIKVYIIERPRIDNVLLIYSDIQNIFKSSIISKVPQSVYFDKKIDLSKLRYSELTKKSKETNKTKIKFSIKKLKYLKDVISSWLDPIWNKNFYLNLNILEFFIFRIRRIIIRNSLKNWIKKKAIDIHQIKKNSVIFFLQKRPESSTVPQAGVYFDQITAIRKLSDLIPKNYQIIVKEHPINFSDHFYKPDVKLINFQKIDQYEIISKIPKVKFVDFDIDSNELIKRSKLVVSLTASLNYDCLFMKKPSLSFSETWYSYCKSSPNFSKKYDDTKKISELINIDDYKIEKDLKKFFKLFFQKAVYGPSTAKIFEKKNKKYQKDSIKNLSLVLWKLIKR